MTQTSSSAAVLFVNICNSLWLYEYLDDRTVRTKIGQCNTLLDDITRRHGGDVVKSIGENITCSFPAAANALEAAMSMQQEMSVLAARDSDALHTKIGLHFGEAVRNDGNILGDALNVATRMAEQAASDQIVTTQRTVDSLPPELRTNIRFLRQTTVEDSCDDKFIFEVIWEIEEAVTRMPPIQRTRDGNANTLTLRHAGQELTLAAQLPSTLVGRDKSCGIVVSDPLASRNHAKIELRDAQIHPPRPKHQRHLPQSRRQEHFSAWRRPPPHRKRFFCNGTRSNKQLTGCRALFLRVLRNQPVGIHDVTSVWQSHLPKLPLIQPGCLPQC